MAQRIDQPVQPVHFALKLGYLTAQSVRLLVNVPVPGGKIGLADLAVKLLNLLIYALFTAVFVAFIKSVPPCRDLCETRVDEILRCEI